MPSDARWPTLGGGKIKINTHIDCTDGNVTYNASKDNWLFVHTDGLPYVNSTYWNGSALVSEESGREAAEFTLTMGDVGYVMAINAYTALAFDVNWRCTVLNPNTDPVNKSKSEWLFIPADDYEALASANHFSVASINVDGLPPKVLTIDVNPQGPKAFYSRYIGQRIKAAQYDIVSLSEDFNYHKHLYGEADGETDRVAPNDGENALQFSYNAGTWRGKFDAGAIGLALVNGFQIDTDGLGLLTRKTSSVTSSEETFHEWSTKHGNLADGFDENLKKGYRYYLITLQDGTEVDLYILHMDAETNTEDNAARESQMQQLTAAILASNNRRPIIVMGDTNCRYTRDRLRSLFLNPIKADPRFTIQDPWVEWAFDGHYDDAPELNYYADGSNNQLVSELGYVKGEVVDKVFIINNRDSKFTLTPLTLTHDMTFCRDIEKPADDDGDAVAANEAEGLADHWPVSVTIDVRKNPDPYDIVTDGDLKSYIRAYNKDGDEMPSYLKSGGAYTTGAVLGKYGIPMRISYDETSTSYRFNSERGTGWLKDDGGVVYVDGAETENRDWELRIADEDHFLIINRATGKAMTRGGEYAKAANGVGPDTHLITMTEPDATNKNQWWSFVTTEDLQTEMLAADETHPYNCTYLFTNPSFDYKDDESKWSFYNGNSEATVASIESRWNKDKGDNRIYTVRTPKWSPSLFDLSRPKKTQYAAYQTMTGLPNGKYEVTLQGAFYGREEAITGSNVFFFIQPKAGINVEREADLSPSDFQDARVLSWVSDSNPSSSDVATAFNNGQYQTDPMYFNITDGNLTVGVRKNNMDVSKGQYNVFFDNFQIYYLGPVVENPADTKTGYYYNVDGGGFLSFGGGPEGTETALGNEGRLVTATVQGGNDYKLHIDGGTNYIGIDREFGRAWVDRNDDHCIFTIQPDGKFLTMNVKTSDNTYGTEKLGETRMGWTGDGYAVTPVLGINDYEPRGTLWYVLDATKYNAYKETVSTASPKRKQYWPLLRSALRTQRQYGHNKLNIASQLAVWRNPGAEKVNIEHIGKQLREIMENEMENAKTDSPVDLSFLLKNTDFGTDLGTAWTQVGDEMEQISKDGPANYRIQKDGVAAIGPYYMQYYVDWGENVPDGELYQTVKGLPDGTYAIAATAVTSLPTDGFTLYADVDKGAEIQEVKLSSTANNVPGYFQTGTFQVTRDKEVKIGIRRKGVTANWVAVDNIRLLYCGPNHSYEKEKNIDYDEKTHGATYDDNILILHGTWRKSEEDELNTIIKDMYDITAVVMSTATVPDGAGIKVILPKRYPENPENDERKGNVLIYVSDASHVSNTENVVVGDECANLVINDDDNFRGFNAFHATKVSYTRKSVPQINSVCLPFTIAQSQIEDFFGRGAQLYTLQETDSIKPNGYINFYELAEGSTHPAGIPCIVTKGDKDDWEISNVEGTFGCSADATNFRTMFETPDPNYSCSKDHLQGSFQRAPLVQGRYYKLSGGKFVRSGKTSTVWPFRFYLVPKVEAGGEVKEVRFMLHSLTDEVTDVTDQLDREEGTYYDLTGRAVGNHPTRPGLYITNGHKVLIK